MTEKDKTIDRSRHVRAEPTISVSARSVRPLLAHFGLVGGDVPTLLRSVRVDTVLFQDPESRLAHSTAVRLWDEVGRLTGDKDLGLHVAELIRPGAFGVLEYLCRASPTLGIAWNRLFRHFRALHDVAEARLEIAGDLAIASHRLPLSGGAPRAVSDFVLAGWLLGAQQATGVDLNPVEVRFPHSAPLDLSEYRRIFRTEPVFGHDRSELVFANNTLDLPLLMADSGLAFVANVKTAALMRTLPRSADTVAMVRRVLITELCDGVPNLGRIAARLHVSARTLHRRIAEQGTTFRLVIADVREELAKRHLMDGKLTIGEIAFLLGFSEVSAFHRAFKRWTGHQPASFRKRQLTQRSVGR